jgi:hypothetical protein
MKCGALGWDWEACRSTFDLDEERLHAFSAARSLHRFKRRLISKRRKFLLLPVFVMGSKHGLKVFLDLRSCHQRSIFICHR